MSKVAPILARNLQPVSLPNAGMRHLGPVAKTHSFAVIGPMSPRRRHHHAFPARAGMNRLHGRIREGRAGVPRTRGDEPLTYDAKDKVIARSPHARG